MEEVVLDLEFAVETSEFEKGMGGGAKGGGMGGGCNGTVF